MEDIDTSSSEEFGGWRLMLVEAYADRVWIERSAEIKWECAVIELKAAR